MPKDKVSDLITDQEIAFARLVPPRRAVEARSRSRLAAEAPPGPGPSRSTFANRLTPSEAPPSYVPLLTSVPDLRASFPIKKNPFKPFVRPR
jgi:hypothetical protein